MKTGFDGVNGGGGNSGRMSERRLFGVLVGEPGREGIYDVSGSTSGGGVDIEGIITENIDEYEGDFSAILMASPVCKGCGVSKPAHYVLKNITAKEKNDDGTK